jgi:class 3 adenylate cyclase
VAVVGRRWLAGIGLADVQFETENTVSSHRDARCTCTPALREERSAALQVSSPRCPVADDAGDANTHRTLSSGGSAHGANASEVRGDSRSAQRRTGPATVRREWTAWLAALAFPLGALVALRLADGLDRSWPQSWLPPTPPARRPTRTPMSWSNAWVSAATSGSCSSALPARSTDSTDLFRPYVPAQLARELAADPTRARLGGEEREVSLVFADLEGFTAFSEQASPAEVIAMLNEYWSLVVPEVLGREDGLIERFSGDAIMVMFNAAGAQPDHALRAVRAALALQRASSTLTRQHPDWPRFRVGVNTGWAIVGNVGTADQRSFAAIGDATNHAARLQAAAAPGEIVIGETTRLALAGSVELEPLAPLHIKGKHEPGVAHRLVAITNHDAT